MKGATGLVCLAMGLVLAGCAPRRAEMCPLPGQTRTESVQLYFGRAIPGGGFVSDDDWSSFAALILTPVFPEGFTVYRALGQWRAADGSIVREQSFVLEQVGAVDPAKLAQVTSAYRARFRQKAVGVVSLPVCAAF